MQSFGSMREVMREGRDQGRVAITGLATPSAIGVGALAGLAGEVTIADGRALVARRDGDAVATREAEPDDRATLLLVAEVRAWQTVELLDVADYATLERQIGAALRAAGVDPRTPTPVRIVGDASELQMHVIAGACPIANPSGPSPWRYRGPADDATLVGFYVEDAVGRLTHHARTSHLHAIVGDRTGHLDEVAFARATLQIPRRGS